MQFFYYRKSFLLVPCSSSLDMIAEHKNENPTDEKLQETEEVIFQEATPF